MTETHVDRFPELFARAERLLGMAYRGIYHIGGWPRRKEQRGRFPYIEVNVMDGISTYDFDLLTRLVVGAHEECVRVEIRASGPRMLKLFISLRDRNGDSICNRHPTIEDAIGQIKEPA